MALVSISEAARLTGKSRTTIQKYIKQGKLSKCTDLQNQSKIDTSELLRVFGEFIVQKNIHTQTVQIEHGLTGNCAVDVQAMQQENASLKLELSFTKKLLDEKDKRNEDLKQALLLLENKLSPKEQPKRKKKTWFFF